MKTTSLIVVAVSTLFSLSMTSCNRYYYKPNGVNAPLLTDAGQLHLVGAGTPSTDADGGYTQFFDFQGAYSPIRHLGIIGQYSTYYFEPYTYNFDLGDVSAFAHFGELGAGGYYAFGEGKFKLVMDAYVGGGLGKLNSDIDLDVRKIFIQPGIGLRSPWLDIAFNWRWSRVAFRNPDWNGRPYHYLVQQHLIDNRGREIHDGGYLFTEPSLTLRGGYKFAKVQMQLALAGAMTTTHWRYNPARFTVGFYFELEGLKETLQKESSSPSYN